MDIAEDIRDQVGDFAHFGFAEAARGGGGGAEADAGGVHGRVDVERDGVFVDGDTGVVQGEFGLLAFDAFAPDVDEEEVCVGAAGDDAVAFFDHAFGEGPRIGDDLALVIDESGLEGLRGSRRLWRR